MCTCAFVAKQMLKLEGLTLRGVALLHWLMALPALELWARVASARRVTPGDNEEDLDKCGKRGWYQTYAKGCWTTPHIMPSTKTTRYAEYGIPTTHRERQAGMT